MVHSSQPINDYDNSNSILPIGAPLHEEKTLEIEAKRLLHIKAKNDHALRYFKALREIEFIMVRI